MDLTRVLRPGRNKRDKGPTLPDPHCALGHPLGTKCHWEVSAAFLPRINSKFQQIPFHTGESQNPRLVWVGKILKLILVSWDSSPQPRALAGRDTERTRSRQNPPGNLFLAGTAGGIIASTSVLPVPVPPGDAWPLSGKEPPALISSELLPLAPRSFPAL